VSDKIKKENLLRLRQKTES